ncbi:hypothetical protein [Lentzea sp. NBRC 102530]|uniref:hypothetical protein n=1 Tax=Lentzea sp. NBRC 102530 TaxID=3032201 RepID=UPI0024A23A53|nr:hypothetical protein [Lentzea sp. NBRC 102530]GLY51661.1 hypothetical protein Lesp01_53170 [Lentzea sp. NBRC 102530]
MKRFLLAVVLSGVPSTVHAVLTGDDLARATRAAGSLVGGGARAGIVVHLAVSAFWVVVLRRLRVRGTVGGVVAGLAIALLDLEVVGRHNAQIRALPRVAQWLDHVAFGVLVVARTPGSVQEQGRQAR